MKPMCSVRSFVGLAFAAATPFACSQATQVTLDLATPPIARAISPAIYGVNFATQAQAAELNCVVNRNGGNSATRYNWQQNCTSSAQDWYFLSHSEDGTGPSGSIDGVVQANKNAGVQSMVTVPILGYVAKLGPNGEWLWSFSVAKYGAQQAVEPWHADAGNGVWTNGNKVTGNNPNDANMPVTIEYQRDWLNHLIGKFGKSNAGGVSYYLLDNEPGLWHETHRDVLPVGAKMQELFNREYRAAIMIKSLDPTAKVVGPEAWGWLEYLYSGYDFQWLGQHNWQQPSPDRAAHGNMDQAAWLLQQFRQVSINVGKRLLDVFSVHYYPQGNYGDGDVSTAAQLWRNRSTRSLWDPAYTDESWIGAKINLIPRLRGWVNAYFPGTQIGITEYEFGAEDHISGAIAQADALGIYGREGVDLATRWVCPATGSRTYNAVKLYRNYDGLKSAFGRYSVALTTPNPDNFSAFGSYDTPGGPYKVMLINKSLTQSQPVRLRPAGATSPRATRYQLTQANTITKLADVVGSGGQVDLSLPAQSITLVIVK